MNTDIIRIDPADIDGRLIEKAAEYLRRGELVAFPTETVYGLGANALDEPAVRSVYAAKGRPSDNPLIIHIWDAGQLRALADPVPPLAAALMERFWPGPLTLILRKRPDVPRFVTSGLDTVAVRMPSHPVARELLRAAGVPVAAPSANVSGRPSPTLAEHVARDLGGRIAAIIDADGAWAGYSGCSGCSICSGGRGAGNAGGDGAGAADGKESAAGGKGSGPVAAIGLESTVIDVSSGEAVILRPGGVTPEDIASVAGGGRVRLNYAPEAAGPGGPGAPGDGESPKSPGVKYRHYAPDAEMLLLKGPRRAVAYWMGRIMERPPGATGDASDTGRASKAGGVFGGPHEAGRPLGGGRPQHARAADYGILASDELLGMLPGGAGFATISLGSAGAPEIAASRLFGALRKFDAMGVGAILCEQPPESGLGLAIADRMKKAASGRVVDLGRASRALFVCTGNTCRSCMAEAIFNALASGALPAAASLAQFQALAHGPAQARQLAQLQAPTPEPAPAPPPAPVLASPPSLSSASAPMLSPAPASAPVPVPAPALSPAPPPACAWRASSAGLAAPDGSPASPEAVEALAAGWGIDLSGHRGRALAPDMLEEADLVLAMTKAHRDAILALRPESRYKVFTLLDGGADIPDPFGRNIGEYMSCAARIAAAVAALLEAIAPPPRAPGA